MSNVVELHRSHNTPSAKPVVHSQDLEDRIMAALPKRLADWIRYESISDLCPVAIYKEWRAGMTADELIASLQAIRRNDTRNSYGMHHPQAMRLPRAA